MIVNEQKLGTLILVFSRAIMKLKIAVLSLLFTLKICPSVTAQISSDGTLSTTVSTDDAVNFLIENGDRSGNNLFHSFLEFSIPNLGSAYFNNATDITNIFSRVTGGNISDIQGLIRANGTANLFLINPAGIVFGENASLDVGGSFFATTAESVVFGDGIEFSAVEPEEAPLLTVNITPGLQMGANPGSITVQGNGHNLVLDFSNIPIRDNRPVGLQVNSGQTLGLIGGDTLLEGGNLTANQGRIELGSIAQSGTVNLIPTNDGFTLDYTEIENFGNLSLTQASSVDVSGEGSGNIHFQAGNISVLEASAIISNILGAHDGGEFLIRASESVKIIGTDIGEFPSTFFNQGELDTTGNVGNLSIETGRFQLATNAFISTSVSGSGNGGDLKITANDIEIFDETSLDPGYRTGLLSQVLLGGIGQGGDLTINAQNVSFRNGVLITTNTNDLGDAGNLNINATTLEIVETNFDNFPTVVSAGTFSSGQAGNLVVNTNLLSVRNGSELSVTTNGEGNGGSLVINANTIELLGRSGGSFNVSSALLANTFSSGNAGNLVIETTRLRVIGGASIEGASLGTGKGGNAIIRASESIEVAGFFSENGQSSFITVDAASSGQGGDLVIETDYLSVRDGAYLAAGSFGEGNGGSLTITANTVEVLGINPIDFSPSGILTDTFFSGNAGDLTIETNSLNVQDGAQLISGTKLDSQGDAGNLNINAAQISLDNQASLQADVAAGKQGNINLTSQLLLLRNNSSITTNAGNLANGGNITIDTVNLVALEDSDITANAVFGRGGNITINTQGLFLSPDSNITASSEFGVDGVVEINTPDEENKLAIAELPSDVTDASEQIAEGCEWTRDNNFYVVGRSGIAKTPQEHIQDYTMWSDIRDFNQAEGSRQEAVGRSEKQERIIEANAWIINERGNVELVAVVPSNNQNLGQVASSCSGEVDS